MIIFEQKSLVSFFYCASLNSYLSQFKITNDLTEFVNSKHAKKIAFIVQHEHELNTNLQIINDYSDIVFYFIDHPNWVYRSGLEKYTNVIWVHPGKFIRPNCKNLFWNTWVTMLLQTNFNHEALKEALDDLNPFSKKEKYFDCLLGNKTDHRDLVTKLLPKDIIEDRFVFSYKGDKNNPTVYYESGTTLLENNLRLDITYRGVNVPNYVVVPIQLYNTTAYSIIAESISEQDLILVSEKIAKPILAKRLFIVFSSPGYLNFLKDLGFQTFDGVIDETYDSIVDEKERFTAAMEQVIYLCNEDQDKILSQIQSIVEHNFNLLTNTDYNELLGSQIYKILDDYSKI